MRNANVGLDGHMAHDAESGALTMQNARLQRWNSSKFIPEWDAYPSPGLTSLKRVYPGCQPRQRSGEEDEHVSFNRATIAGAHDRRAIASPPPLTTLSQAQPSMHAAPGQS